MNQYKRIFIVGHPGAGKALLAKTLAEKLSWQFINADLGLEFFIGRTLTEIVGKQGEEAFHHCQSEILKNLLSQENIVVTTDASIVCNERNRQLLSSEFVVNLKVSTPIQIERNLRNPTQLLPTDLKAFLDKLHHERDGLYEQVASFSISSDDSALEKHVSSIINVVSETKGAKLRTNQITLDKNDVTVFHKDLHVPIALTYQQAKCLKLLAQGKSAKEIARDMNISYRTAEGYITQMMQLLGCSSSKELIALYHDQP